VIHQCGNTADGNQDHAIYADNSVNAVIDNNVIWGAAAYAVHLYQNSQGSQITHNVIVGNGYGVIFAGSDLHHSSGNVVSDNIIANSTAGYDVSSYWGGTVGSGNVLKGNCLAGGRRGQITTVKTGFAASGNVTATPGFVNAAAHNYRLGSGSPCLSVVGYDTEARIGAGAAVATVSSTRRVHSTRTRTVHPTRGRVARPRHGRKDAHHRKVVKTNRTHAQKLRRA
jgi:copper-binding protein NosD